MFTTLLCLLYPPLKGFSHRLCPHIRVGHFTIPKSPSRGAPAKWLSHVKIGKIELNLHQKELSKIGAVTLGKGFIRK